MNLPMQTFRTLAGRFARTGPKPGLMTLLSDLELRAMTVSVSLADSHTGRFFATVESMATLCGTSSVHRIRKALHRLEQGDHEAGLPPLLRRTFKPAGGRGIASEWQLLASETLPQTGGVTDGETLPGTVRVKTPKTRTQRDRVSDGAADENPYRSVAQTRTVGERKPVPKGTPTLLYPLSLSTGASAPVPAKPTTTEKPKVERKPDPIWDTVARIWFGGAVATPDRKRVGKIVRDFKAHGATPEEIEVRLQRYRTEWPKAAATATALLKHWAMFATATPATSTPTTPTPADEWVNNPAPELLEAFAKGGDL